MASDWVHKPPTLDMLLEGFEREIVQRETALTRPRGGQSVQDVGDFVSCPPSTLSRLRWWHREFQTAAATLSARNRELTEMLYAVVLLRDEGHTRAVAERLGVLEEYLAGGSPSMVREVYKRARRALAASRED